MTVIYEVREDKPKRYRVEFWASGKWIQSSISHRIRIIAKSHAADLASSGYRARVIDTKGEEA